MEADNLQNANSQPSAVRLILGFMLVGIAWGFTTPFMRVAAIKEDKRKGELIYPGHDTGQESHHRWLKSTVLHIWDAITSLLRRPGYLVPLVINLTGSVWFFLLVGQVGEHILLQSHRLWLTDCPELSLTVPITNSLAFLFTVLGEWWAEGKVIQKNTWIGMALVLSGIALCVQSKL